MKLMALISGLFFVAGHAMAAVKTCQTAAEIKAHVETPAPEDFCYHRVLDPTVDLVSAKTIPTFNQLKSNLEVAFLNTKRDFDGAQASCASIGDGWHAPASNNWNVSPRANDNSNSLEAVGEYFKRFIGWSIWSSSTVSDSTYNAWGVYLAGGYTYYGSKTNSFNVVCVRP
jgi:hypothetical protein